METYAQAMCFQVPRFSVMGISPFLVQLMNILIRFSYVYPFYITSEMKYQYARNIGRMLSENIYEPFTLYVRRTSWKLNVIRSRRKSDQWTIDVSLTSLF